MSPPRHARAAPGRSRRRLLGIIGAVAVAVALAGAGVVACGSSSETASSPTSAGAPGANGSTATSPGTTGRSSTTSTTVAPTTTTTTIPPAAPAPLGASAFATAGQTWTGVGRSVGSAPAVYTVGLHAGGEPVAAAWMDTARLSARIYAGTDQPAGHWTYQGLVGTQDQASLVAACNGGFKFADAPNGFYADGTQGEPLRPGLGSFVVRADGTATVGDWGRDVDLTPDVVAVRQNLPLLVDGGQPAADAGSTGAWGDPLHGNPDNYRSAIGVDADGHLIYVAGPALLPLTLAQILVSLGAVRAMELDINPEWVTFVTFTGAPPAVSGADLLTSMYFPTTHFVSLSERDFLAFFARPGA